MQFWFHKFGFCTCANIKRVPGYTETDPDVQITDNYLDNWVSVSDLIIITLTATGSTAAFIVPNNKADGIDRLEVIRLAADSPNRVNPKRIIENWKMHYTITIKYNQVKRFL